VYVTTGSFVHPGHVSVLGIGFWVVAVDATIEAIACRTIYSLFTAFIDTNRELVSMGVDEVV
jgi:hypothetical protein